MNVSNKKIIELSTYAGIFVIIGVFVALPRFKEIKKLELRHQRLQKEIKLMKLDTAGFIESEEPKLKEELGRLNNTLPNKVDYVLLYKRFINQYKNRHKIAFTLFEPAFEKPEREKQDHNNKPEKEIIPVKLSFKSDYTTMVDYIAYIENMGFITSMEKTSMKVSDNDSNLLNINMVINLYVGKSSAGSQYTKKRHTEDREYTISAPSKIAFISMQQEINKKPKTLDVKIAGIIGDNTIIVGDEIYEIGNKINDWTISKINSNTGEVLFINGKSKEIRRID